MLDSSPWIFSKYQIFIIFTLIQLKMLYCQNYVSTYVKRSTVWPNLGRRDYICFPLLLRKNKNYSLYNDKMFAITWDILMIYFFFSITLISKINFFKKRGGGLAQKSIYDWARAILFQRFLSPPPCIFLTP
jgi:hypothetical protein